MPISHSLQRLSEKDLSANEIAEHLGVSSVLVLRAMHRFHLPVRVHRNGAIETRVRYDELVANKAVLAQLKKHGVILVGIDPPNRPPLPVTLLKELRNTHRLSFFDIELLTGRAWASAKLDATKAGID